MRCNIALAFGLGASTAMASSHFKAAARQPVYQRQAPGQSVSSDLPGPSSVASSVAPGPSGAPANPGTIGGYSLLGCVGSDGGFPGFVLGESSGAMTNELCIASCPTGTKFAGTNGRDCYCGEDLGTAESVAPGSCNIECPGNALQSCGGSIGGGVAKRQLPLSILLTVYVLVEPVPGQGTVTVTGTTTVTDTVTTTFTGSAGSVVTATQTITRTICPTCGPCQGPYCPKPLPTPGPDAHCYGDDCFKKIVCFGGWCTFDYPCFGDWCNKRVVCHDDRCRAEECYGDDCHKKVCCTGDSCKYETDRHSEGDYWSKKVICYGDHCEEEKCHGDECKKNYVCHGDECGHETCHGDECHNTKVYCQGKDCKAEEECHDCKPAPVKPWTPEDEKTWNNKHTAEYPAQPQYPGQPQHPGQPQQPAKPVTPVNPAKPVTPTGNVYPEGDHVVVAGAEKAIASFGVIAFAAAALFL
ncbi:hypothetical protein VD0004_g6293 [Verticillium dahliae]|uniref:Uncharacterized protein n=1 Tax=Verticillium dahliae TaxID=27337 RepID=A0A366P5J5_VERDA|nr:Vacuolar protein sorting-associated protein 27 [Verticillium dahliae VDG1]PNH40735.1 hypothetical protein VD0004_g6293 [Verticillium dahliae]PNH72385.1 hypothetical protein VD0001_g5186 [Verticillium dahliae]RBQ87871.1 hypothetical protein VDGD_05035 [Verticillium dahliae]RXG44430.1 hypothetical protein VDGE_05035 [Verticillium dahliae]